MNETELRRLLAAVADGALPRRHFIERMVGLGLSVPMAAAMLAGTAQAQPAAAFNYKPAKRGGGGVLKLLYWQGPTLLNPHFATGTKDNEGSRPFYEPLARYDADGQLQPVLAAEIPNAANGGVAANGLSVTWKLKKGVQWHDGQPFTADDLIFNWRYATDPAAAAYTVGLYEGVKSFDKVDSHTVRIVYEKPMPGWQPLSTVLLIPQHVFGSFIGAKAREAPANLKPVGTGPYKFAEFKPGDLVRGVINAQYHMANRPYFDGFEMKGGGDAPSAARAVLQTGEYDFAWNVLVEDDVLKRMEAGGKGRVVVSPGGTTEYIHLNMADPWVETEGERAHPKSRHPLLSDPAVRQALTLLVDRQSIQQFVFGRAGVATVNILNNPPRYNSRNLKTEFNIDKANAVLDAAGWKRGADGVREKGGKKLHLVYQSSINALRQKVQAIFKQSCQKAGIDIEIKGVTAAVFFSSDVSNPDTIGKFWADLQMFAFTRGPDPARFMQNFVSWELSAKANKWLAMNRGRWVNAEYDRLFKAAETELDPVKRADLFIRMNDIVCTDGQVLPIVFRPQMDAVSNKIVAPLTGWDTAMSAIHDWYREA